MIIDYQPKGTKIWHETKRAIIQKRRDYYGCALMKNGQNNCSTVANGRNLNYVPSVEILITTSSKNNQWSSGTYINKKMIGIHLFKTVGQNDCCWTWNWCHFFLTHNIHRVAGIPIMFLVLKYLILIMTITNGHQVRKITNGVQVSK